MGDKVNVLSTNRDLEKEVEKGAKMLSVDIKKTPFYKMGIKEGIERGIEKGIEQGIKQGIKKGKRNAKLESAYIMVTKYHLPLSQIAKDFELQEQELKEYILNKS